MFRLSNALFIGLLSFLVISCDDNSTETNDITGPEITVESPNENQRVKGTVTIKAIASDMSTVASMDAYVDGKPLIKSPGAGISVLLDTKTLSEGFHSIKITATDSEGNSSQKTFNIEVRNTIFIVHVPVNYVHSPEYTKVYFGLSKNDGTVIAFGQLENGTTVSVPSPSDFDSDSSFVYTQYMYENRPPDETGPGQIVRQINVYAGMDANEFYLPEKQKKSYTVTGSHLVELTGVPDGFQPHFYGKNIYASQTQYGGSGVYAGTLFMLNNTSDCFINITNGKDAASYTYLSAVELGAVTNLDVTGLPQMQLASITTKAAEGFFAASVSGWTADPNSPLRVFDSYSTLTGPTMPICYPGATFSQYHFQIGLKNDGDVYENTVRSATPPLSFSYLDADIESVDYSDRRLKMTTTGVFDVVTLQGYESNVVDNYFIMDIYSISFPNTSTKQVTIPNIPEELSDLDFTLPSDTDLSEGYAIDYFALSTIADYQQHIAFNRDNLDLWYRDKSLKSMEVTLTNSGGRVSAGEKVTLPESLKQTLRSLSPIGNSIIWDH